MELDAFVRGMSGVEIEARLKLVRAQRRLLQLQNSRKSTEVEVQSARYDVEEAQLEIALQESQREVSAPCVLTDESMYVANTPFQRTDDYFTSNPDVDTFDEFIDWSLDRQISNLEQSITYEAQVPDSQPGTAIVYGPPPPPPKRKRSSREEAIPGAFCFYSRPPPKRVRRQLTKFEQAAVNRLRMKGACLYCRLKNLKCSEDDPCRACAEAIERQGHTLSSFMSSSCLRSFSDVDPFEFLRGSTLSYITTARPQWSHLATGRGELHPTLSKIQILSVVDLINMTDISPLACVKPSEWANLGSKTLRIMDALVKKKSFWKNKGFILVLLAASDLLMSVCLDLALYVQFIQKSLVAMSDLQVVMNLQQRLSFCIHRLRAFRGHVLPKLQSLGELGCLEDSAMTLLQLSVQSYPQARNYVTRLRSIRELDSSGLTSKELLLLQATKLKDIGLVQEAITAGAVPSLAYVISSRNTAFHCALEEQESLVIEMLLSHTHNFPECVNEQNNSCIALDTDTLDHRLLRPSILGILRSNLCTNTINRYVLLQAIAGRLRSLFESDSTKQGLSYLHGLLMEPSVHLKSHRDQQLCQFAAKICQRSHIIDLCGTVTLPSRGTILHILARHDEHDQFQKEIFQLLISKNAMLNRTDAYGRTALHYACRDQMRQAVEMLLKAGVNSNITDNNGRSAAHYVCRSSGAYENAESSFILAALARSKANFDLKDYDGNTPLHRACMLQDIRAVAVLLEAESDTKSVNWSGQTPLHLACFNDTPIIVWQLLRAGGYTASVDYEKRTPLHIARAQNWPKTVTLLLEAGKNAKFGVSNDQIPLPLGLLSRFALR